jgi:hypothetical protein
VLGFRRKLPITDEEREWVDDSFAHLASLLGRNRMLEAKVVLPLPEHFPDHYDGTPETVEGLFRRVCGYMRVDRNEIDLEVFPDDSWELHEVLPSWSYHSQGAAGLYTRNQATSRMVVALQSSQLKDPLRAVATLAHELGHVILLGGRLIEHDVPNMEPLTDLLTVFLGFGVFTSTAAARLKKFQDDRNYGWSMHRQGYLPEIVYGYALARFATERGETQPGWVDHLSVNVKTYYKQSRRWLRDKMKR